MSAAGKLDFHGDFDEQGQLVDVPYRPTLMQRNAAAARRSGRDEQKTAPAQIVSRPRPIPPAPAPLTKKPVPADLVLDHDRDLLLTAFGKATLTDRYLL